jgi:hypothetical protein
MTQLTVIVVLYEGLIESTRIHQGIKDEALVLDYLSHLHDVVDDTRVEMWPIDLYSDIGDLSGPVWRYRLFEGAWVPY